MDIRKDQFGAEAVRLLQNIANSHFIAFDFEFSGIAERDRNRSGKADLEDRYEETRASVEEFQPLQIGLTIVKLDEEKGQYVLEPYNLNISPLPSLRERQFTRKWSMSSGAVSFLYKNGFDFQRQMVHGVPYLSLQEEQKARAKMTADAKRDDMAFKPDDQKLIDHVRESIASWQAQPIEEQEEYLNIPHGQPPGITPTLNGYQRRLVHQLVQNEFPAMKTQGMNHFIQITNPSSEKQASQKLVEDQYREKELGRAIGFRWILDGIIGRDLTNLPEDYLLSALPPSTNAANGEESIQVLLNELIEKLKSRRKILIGHNCLTDVMFLYKMAVGTLPSTLSVFKDKIHELFPAIVDTKHLASCFSEKHGRLALGEVADDLEDEKGVFPEIYTPVEFDRYINNTLLHEAGYDSYLTAKVAIRMATKLHRDGTSRKKDQERQQLEVARPDPADFGVQDGYVTATESLDGRSEISSPPSHQEDNLSHNHSNTENGTITPSAVIAIKKTRTDPIDGKDENQVSALRSAFATTSIYESFASSSASMPGDETPQHPTATTTAETDDSATRINRLVKEGRLMPRWHEEGAFWEFYGNKLQCNGTVEGVMQIGD